MIQSMRNVSKNYFQIQKRDDKTEGGITNVISFLKNKPLFQKIRANKHKHALRITNGQKKKFLNKRT